MYADDLNLLTTEPCDMQNMLSRLAVYARNKHLIVNTSKSEVVHFNSAGGNVPVFDVGGATLHHKDSFRYLGMVFYRTLNMAKSAEHASRPFLASAYRIRRFVCEHALADRPHTSLWLAEMYVIPAGKYGSQVWGTVFLQAGRETTATLCVFPPFSCVWRLLPSSWFSSASSVLRSLNFVLYLGFFSFSWFPLSSGSP